MRKVVTAAAGVCCGSSITAAELCPAPLLPLSELRFLLPLGCPWGWVDDEKVHRGPTGALRVAVHRWVLPGDLCSGAWWFVLSDLE